MKASRLLPVDRHMHNQENIEKWLNGSLTEDEKQRFEQTEDYKSLERLSNALASFKAPDYNVAEEFKRLQAKRSARETAKVVSLTWMKPLLRVAAVIIVMVGVYFYFLYQTASSFSTLVAEKTELFLPDSSLVILNASSSISYNAKSWSMNRHVTLEGEAFFKVAKGSRFDVVTETGTISVLGTQFNVKKRKDYFEVICYEGLVQVAMAEKNVQLAPGKMLRAVNGRIVPQQTTLEAGPAWVMHESSFESVPFYEVIAEFERQYDVRIVTQGVDLEQLFTGRFVHDNLTLALKSISIPLHLTYEINSKRVVLTGETL